MLARKCVAGSLAVAGGGCGRCCGLEGAQCWHFGWQAHRPAGPRQGVVCEHPLLSGCCIHSSPALCTVLRGRLLLRGDLMLLLQACRVGACCCVAARCCMVTWCCCCMLLVSQVITQRLRLEGLALTLTLNLTLRTRPSQVITQRLRLEGNFDFKRVAKRTPGGCAHGFWGRGREALTSLAVAHVSAIWATGSIPQVHCPLLLP